MRSIVCLTLAFASLWLVGCAAPGTTVTPTRANPTGTVEVFKVALSRDDFGGMWDVLSPEFKRRLNQRAGRNVDEADFTMAWKSMRSDARVRLAESMLESARVTNVSMQGEDKADVTVQAGPGGPIGKEIEGRMVRLIRWELRVRGDPQPYWGIVGDPMIGIERSGDGGYVVWTRGDPNGQPDRQTFSAQQVESYNAQHRWYVDGLGELEQQFFQ